MAEAKNGDKATKVELGNYGATEHMMSVEEVGHKLATSVDAANPSKSAGLSQSEVRSHSNVLEGCVLPFAIAQVFLPAASRRRGRRKPIEQSWSQHTSAPYRMRDGNQCEQPLLPTLVFLVVDVCSYQGELTPSVLPGLHQ
jgi:hypothetical protein